MEVFLCCSDTTCFSSDTIASDPSLTRIMVALEKHRRLARLVSDAKPAREIFPKGLSGK
ncbi:hypothetical protein K3495_g4469 [Podosphaera aphanis]|nr:hypothetical protein K3495_g4469 [Podosphaera aphanis]